MEKIVVTPNVSEERMKAIRALAEANAALARTLEKVDTKIHIEGCVFQKGGVEIQPQKVQAEVYKT